MSASAWAPGFFLLGITALSHGLSDIYKAVGHLWGPELLTVFQE